MYLKNEKTQAKPHKIYYWNGIVDPQDLGSKYADIIDKIAQGDYEGLDFEKLVGHDVYSARINKRDRLLFTTITVQGKRYLMLLDEVLNHDYAKSRFLKPAVLKSYLELHGQALSDELIETHFQSIDESTNFLKEKKQKSQELQLSRIDSFMHTFIELDTLQREVVEKTSLPLIISGGAGSGKSCVALLILEQYVCNQLHNIAFPILYVTESENLAASMRRAWQALPAAHNLPADAVQFKSYQQLLATLVNVDKVTFVGKKHCMEWLAHPIKHYQATTKNTKNTPIGDASFFADTDAIYQEFRIISGCNTLESYIQLGSRQSRFHDTPQQEWLYNTCKRYQQELLNSQFIHTAFSTITTQGQYKRIIVDEAQDFSHLQLEMLARLAENKQICYCEDYRQSLSDNKSKLPFLKGLLYSWNKPINHITLNTSYRAPKAVIELVNKLSALKSFVTDEGQPDMVTPSEDTLEGTVRWFTNLTEQEELILRKAATSPDFAIITTMENIPKAKETYQTDLVFTIEQIKGLQYKYILADGLFDDVLFKQADKLINQYSPDITKKSGHRPKKDQGHAQFGPPFCRMYTAWTRTTDTLYIKETQPLPNIMAHLKTTLPPEQIKPLEIVSTTSEDHSAEWHKQVKIQMTIGNFEIARNIYIRLGKTDAEFEALKTQFSGPVDDSMPVKTDKKRELPVKSNPAVQSPETPARTKPGKISRLKTPNPPVNRKPASTIDDKKINVPKEIIQLLQKTLSETALFTFLTKNKKNAQELLFNYPLSDGPCLFASLCNDPSVRLNLFKCIRNCLHNPKLKNIFQGLTEAALSWSIPNGDNSSPLYWFAAGNDAQTSFLTLLIANPKLAYAVNAKTLCQPRTHHSGFYVNASPLLFFSVSPEGQEILKILLAENPAIAKSISGDALCLARNSKAGPDAHATPMFCLAATAEGREILITLLAKNPELVLSIRGDALCLPRPLAAKRYANTSILSTLTESARGQKILKYLLENNPNLAKSITTTALCRPLTEGAEESAYASPLFFLAKDPTGLEILKILFAANTDMEQYIKKEALCRCTSLDKKNPDDSPLSLLKATTAGQEILETLCNNPLLAEIIREKESNQSSPSQAGLFSNIPSKTNDIINNINEPKMRNV